MFTGTNFNGPKDMAHIKRDNIDVQRVLESAKQFKISTATLFEWGNKIRTEWIDQNMEKQRSYQLECVSNGARQYYVEMQATLK